MAKVANLTALKLANNGDYIERSNRGRLERLVRTGIDEKGNLVTDVEIEYSTESVSFTPTSTETLDEGITNKAIAPNTFTKAVWQLRNPITTALRDDIERWKDGNLATGQVFQLSPRPIVLGPATPDQWYRLPKAPLFSNEPKVGTFVHFRNPGQYSYEIRLQDNTDSIWLGGVPGFKAVTVPPRSDAYFYALTKAYSAHVLDTSKSKNMPDFTTGDITLEYYAEGDSSVDGIYYPAISPDAAITLPPMIVDRRILLATDWAARAAIDPPPTWVTDGTDILDPAENTFPRDGTSFVWAIADTSTTPSRWLIRAAGTIESTEADANAGVDRLLDSGPISLTPLFRDEDTVTTGYTPHVFGEALSEGDVCFYEYSYGRADNTDHGTGIATLRNNMQHRFLSWDVAHRIKVIWAASVPNNVWFAAGVGNLNLRIIRIQILRKAQLIQNQYITLTQAAYIALTPEQKTDSSKLYLING